MAGASNCKCVISFLWTSALVVAVLVFALFTFIDPVDIAVMMMLDVDEGLFRIKAYFFSFLFLWILLNTSTFLNYYFTCLRNNKFFQQ